MMRFLLSILLPITLVFGTHAQFNDLFTRNFHNITTDNGLASMETYSVKQDSKGYIWICTDRGVTRYDGYYFQTFTSKDGLTDNVVFNTYEDLHGNIWFITMNSLLSYFDGRKIVPYAYNDLITACNGFVNSPIKSLHIDKNDNLYFSSRGGGLIKINAQGKLKFLEQKSNDLELQHFDNVVIPSLKINPKTPLYSRSLVYYKDKATVDWEVQSVNRFYVLNEGKSDFLFLDDMILNFKSGEIAYKGNLLINVQSTDDSVFYLSHTKGVEIHHLINGKLIFQRWLVKDVPVSSVDIDLLGGIWISTLSKGVLYSNPVKIERALKASLKLTNGIEDIASVDDKLYVSSSNGWTELGSTVFHQKESHDGFSVKLTKFRGRLVVADRIKYNEKRWVDNVLKTRMSATLKSDDTHLYFGHMRMYRLRLEDNTHIQDTLLDLFRNEKHFSFRIRAIEILDKERIIIGGYSGVYELKDNQLYPYITDPLLQTSKVRSMLYSKNWGLIVTTSENGVFICKNGKVVQHITHKKGLLSNSVFTVKESTDGILLFGTSKGINFIRPKSKKIRAISSSDGLDCGDVTSIEFHKDHIYLGSKKGLYRFHKSIINAPPKTVISPILLDNIQVNNVRTETQKGNLRIPFNTGVIRVKFRTFNFNNWDLKKYQYRISNTGNWIDINAPEIIIPEPKGNFTIHVRYKIDNNHWSSSKQILHVHELIPFWTRKTILFFVLSSLFVLTIFLVWRRQKVKINQLKLDNQIISLQQRVEDTRLNPHFVFNALNSIQSFILFNEKDKAETYLNTFASVMRKLLVSSRDGVIQLQDEIESIQGYLEIECFRKENITFTIQNDVDHNATIPSLVLQPIVENALIHGIQSRGSIYIQVTQHDAKTIYVQISNSGLMTEEQQQSYKDSSHSNATGINRKRLENYNRILSRNDLTIAITNDTSAQKTVSHVYLPILTNKANENINR